MVGQLQCSVSKNTKEKEIHSVQNSKCQRESCNVSKLLMYSKLAQSNMYLVYTCLYIGKSLKTFQIGIIHNRIFTCWGLDVIKFGVIFKNHVNNRGIGDFDTNFTKSFINHWNIIQIT